MTVVVDHLVRVDLHLHVRCRLTIDLHVLSADSRDRLRLVEEARRLSSALVPVEAGGPDELEISANTAVAIL